MYVSMIRADATTKKLYKESKRLMESVLAVNRFESRMTTDLSNSVLCQQEDQLRSVVEEWHTFTIESIKNGEEFATSIHLTITEPLKRWQMASNEIKASIKRYEQLKSDLIKYNNKKQKYSEREKTSNNILKLKNVTESLANAESQYHSETQLLNKEIPLFIERRIDYFQPSLAALISSEAQYWGSSVTSFRDHDSMIRDNGLSDYCQRQSQRLADINSLSIVANE